MPPLSDITTRYLSPRGLPSRRMLAHLAALFFLTFTAVLTPTPWKGDAAGSSEADSWDSTITSEMDAAVTEVDNIDGNDLLRKGVREVAKGAGEVIIGVRKVFSRMGSLADAASGANVLGGRNQGGAVVIITDGVGWNVYGSHNSAENANGGKNLVVNTAVGRIGWGLFGSYNSGIGSRGGGNTVINNGGLGWSLCGSCNVGESSTGGDNLIMNMSGVGWSIYGSYNQGDNSSGGGNSILNHKAVGWSTYGSNNQGDGTRGGNNLVLNTSGIGWSIYGSYNHGDNSSGGGNTVINAQDGTVGYSVIGSWNLGSGSIGTGNTIVNFGLVHGSIYGSRNDGGGSTGGGNTIENHGTIEGSVYGSLDNGAGSASSGNSILNTGTVGGSILAGSGDDTVAIGNGSSVGRKVDGQDGQDSLVFRNAGTISGGQYVNFETLLVEQGRTSLTGILEVNGPAKVEGGLYLQGELHTSDLTVASGGRLGGSGLLVGDLTINGILAPGNSIGTLNVQGDAYLSSGSVYAVELGGSGMADSLQATGTVNIDSAALSLEVVSPQLVVSSGTWEILQADGGVTGAFESVALRSMTMGAAQEILADSINVRITRTTPYSALAADSAQLATASALDAILASTFGSMADLIASMDFSYDLAEIRQALERLGPAEYAAYPEASLRSTRLVERAVSLELRNAARENPEHIWHAWARGLGDWGRIEKRREFGDYQWTTGGLVLGLDHRPTPWLRMGLDFACTETSLRWSDSNSRGRQDGKYAGAHIGVEYGGFSTSAMVLGGIQENSGTRRIVLADRTARANADFDAASLLSRLDLAYELRSGAFSLAPRMSFTRVQTWQSSFNESDAGYLGLHLDSTNQALSSLEFGSDASYALELEHVTLRARMVLAWRHDIPDSPGSGASLSARFLDYPGSSMRLHAPAPQSNSLLADIGVSTEIGKYLSASANYSLTCGGAEIAHGFGVTFGLNF